MYFLKYILAISMVAASATAETFIRYVTSFLNQTVCIFIFSLSVVVPTNCECSVGRKERLYFCGRSRK